MGLLVTRSKFGWRRGGASDRARKIGAFYRATTNEAARRKVFRCEEVQGRSSRLDSGYCWLPTAKLNRVAACHAALGQLEYQQSPCFTLPAAGCRIHVPPRATNYGPPAPSRADQPGDAGRGGLCAFAVRLSGVDAQGPGRRLSVSLSEPRLRLCNGPRLLAVVLLLYARPASGLGEIAGREAAAGHCPRRLGDWAREGSLEILLRLASSVLLPRRCELPFVGRRANENTKLFV